MQRKDQSKNLSGDNQLQTTQQKKQGHSETGDAARFTIGLMLANIVAPWERLWWDGVMDAARDGNVNVICFTGEEFRSPFGFNAQANIVYELINADHLDGLIIWMGYTYLNQDEIHAFYHQRYASLPKVAIEQVVEGIPSIQGDDYLSMQIALRHLIEEHGYRRIAFIQGTEHHFGIQERYRAYRETLAEYGIPFDPSLVRLFYAETMRSEDVGHWLLDELPLPVEALVGHNDSVTLPAIRGLQARGVRIPHDIAIVGFDNIEESRTTFPALTTVESPFYDMGRKAVAILVDRLEGHSIPERTVLSGHLVVRQSCGCRSQQVKQASVESMPIVTMSVKDDFRARREAIMAEIRQSVGISEHDDDWLTPLLDGFEREMLEGVTGGFLQAIESGLSASITTGGPIAEWHGVLSTLRHHILPCLSEGRLVLCAENLWQQARVVISEALEGYRMNQAFQSNRQTQLLRQIEAQLMTTFDIPQLIDIMAEQLPHLKIPGCYLALYEDPQPYAYPQPIPQWSRLMLAYNAHGRIPLERQGQRFRSQQLLPAELFPQEHHNNFLVKPLYFHTQQIGFVVFEVGSKDGHIYAAICSQLSSALQGALLIKRVQEHALELTAANEEIKILNHQLKDENLRMHAEMDVARRIQTALLPPMVKHLHPDFEIAAVMLPAAEVGGDYYDITLDQEGTLWFGIGDVSGHGVTPGLIMMMAQTVHTTITTNYRATPKDIVIMLNKVLFKNVRGRLGEDHFMTFTTLKYLGDGRFQHAGAHLALIVYRQRLGACELIDTKGVWLNFIDDIAHATWNAEFTLDVGDLLVLYTDGLTEAFNSQHEMLDIARFTEIVHRHVTNEVETCRDAILKDVLDWCAGNQKDDMSLVVARRIH